jgi:FkbM family methyltransferase
LPPRPDHRLPPLRRLIDALPRFLRRQRLLRALVATRCAAPEQLLHFNGAARAWIDLRDAESRATYLSGSFWPEVHELIGAFLRPGGHVFDVGANFGLVTFGLLPSDRAEGTEFHLFEANHRIVPLLRRSVAEWPDAALSIRHCCVTDVVGSSLHHLPDEAWGHGAISAQGDPVVNLRLDDYIGEHGIGQVTFLKLDIEGWEPRALRGARSAMEAGVIEAGFVEVSPESLARAGSSSAVLLDLLRASGFDLYFAKVRDSHDPHERRWTSVEVGGTRLLIAGATPLPATFVQDDVLVVHRSSPHHAAFRSALERSLPNRH